MQRDRYVVTHAPSHPRQEGGCRPLPRCFRAISAVGISFSLRPTRIAARDKSLSKFISYTIATSMESLCLLAFRQSA